MIEKPCAVCRVAVEHDADDLIVLQHEAFVDAARSITQHNLLALGRLGEIARGEQVDAGDFELRRRRGWGECGRGVARQLSRDNARHVVERGYETEHLTVRFGAFTEGEDVGIAGAHTGVDDDPAIDRQSRIFGDAGVGPDPHRHDDEVRCDPRTVFEQHGLDLLFAEDGFGIGAAENFDAARFDGLGQQMPRRRIELPLHQRRRKMHDGHVHAALAQPRRRLETEQAATDDDSTAASRRSEQHRLNVVEIAISEHARQLVAWDGNDDRLRAGRDDELVVGHGEAACRRHGLSRAIDRGDRRTLVERDAVLHIPTIAMDDDLLEGFLAGEHRRQHDAIVVHAWFGIEDRHVEGVGRQIEKLVECTSGRHAVADDDQTLARRWRR